MAQLLIIKAETVRDGLQYIGDVVGVFEDSHVFSETEIAKFNVLTVGGSAADVRTRLQQLTPRIEEAYRSSVDEKYHFGMPPEEPLEIIKVYRLEGDSKWYKAENKFKFPMTVDELTPEEKQLLETVNINHPSVDSFIRKLIKDISVLSGNDVEIKDLRNTEP